MQYLTYLKILDISFGEIAYSAFGIFMRKNLQQSFRPEWQRPQNGFHRKRWLEFGQLDSVFRPRERTWSSLYESKKI